MTQLDGLWRVERVSGALPPMYGVRKRIAGERGVTLVGPVALPFRVRGLSLRYCGPLAPLVDHLEPDGDDFSGRATLLSREIGRFRMVRIT